MAVFRYGIIGAGSLGGAVIEALDARGHRDIMASRRCEDALSALKATYPYIRTTTDNREVARYGSVLVLATKPNTVQDVAREIGPYTGGKLVVSLAAKISIADIATALANHDANVARVMTGIFVRDEIAAYSMEEYSEDVESKIKYAFGERAIEVHEEQLAHRTWVACDTGLLAESVERKIEALDGMDADRARLFYAGMLKAIACRLEAGMTGHEIIAAVGGKGSFTLRLHERLEREGHYAGVEECVRDTVRACGGKG